MPTPDGTDVDDECGVAAVRKSTKPVHLNFLYRLPTSSSDLESAATALFFDHLIDSPYYDVHFDDLDFCRLLYTQTASGSILTDAVVALGYIALAQAQTDNRYLFEAQNRYAVTIQRTNEALRDYRRAKDDDVLATVILLGLYEVCF